MEKGTLRVDANVSVRPLGTDELRTRCEIKNMNSFNYIARGIDAEVARQIEIWESGGEVKQETFDFDAGSGTLTPRRSKEEADDYRYFPEPDLVPVEPPAEMVERLRAELPESPSSRIARLASELDLERALVLVTGGLDPLYEATVAAGADRIAAANVIANNLVGAGVDPSRVDARELALARRGPRADPAAGARRGDREGRRRRIHGGAVPRAGGGLGCLRARPGDRRDHRRQPRPGGGVQGRQGGVARLLRRPGDEGDRRFGKSASRKRARPRQAELEPPRTRSCGDGPRSSDSCLAEARCVPPDPVAAGIIHVCGER